MKKKLSIVVILILVVCVLSWVGVGYRGSASAILDLKEHLEYLHGQEYRNKPVDNGTETMVFTVTSKSFFLTNWNVRNLLGLDYKYECKVVITSYVDGKQTKIRTITYQGFDPMGLGREIEDRAYVDVNSKNEK